MTRLEWNAAGERFYEAGVDRGVLYIDYYGVVWNGLISVEEQPSGGDATGRYVDGIRYYNKVAVEEFAATVEAYTYPEEFGQCDGTSAMGNGLFATQQKRKPFGLTYRTKVGNDVDGADHAYKIHLIYNATAAPSSRSNSTFSDSFEALNFSWDLAVRPPIFDGYKPTAHFVVDTRTTPAPVLKQIEDILYGTDTTVSRQPEVDELLFIFQSFNANIYSGGRPKDRQFETIDGGVVPIAQTNTLDGGAP